MSSEDISNIDCVIIGDSISSILLAILLAKKRDNVLFIRNSNGFGKLFNQHYSLVSLNFFRVHSIPYNELGIKNKSSDTYIERFITFEKWFLPKNSRIKHDFNFFYTFRQFGVVNHQLFKNFLNKLLNKEKTLLVDSINDSFELIKLGDNKANSFFKIKTSNREIEVPSNKVIMTDIIFKDYLKEKFVTTKLPIFKYQLKVDELLSDSVNHYFFGSERAIKKITIIPCSKFSIIELFSMEEVMDPLNIDIIEFLENKYDIHSSELEFQFKEMLYLDINSEILKYLNIIPSHILFSYPIQSALFTKLEASLYLSIDLDNETIIKYNDWLKQTFDKYNLVNRFFMDNESEDIRLLMMKLIKNKDIAHMNKISKFLINIRFNLSFKRKNLIFKEFETIIKILSYSEII